MTPIRIDQTGIAARIRSLLGVSADFDYGTIAQRLGITEVALRMSADDLDPHPTFEALVAIIRVYGVDPGWLVTGNYDAGAHRTTLDSADENRVGNVLSNLLAADARSEGLSEDGRREA